MSKNDKNIFGQSLDFAFHISIDDLTLISNQFNPYFRSSTKLEWFLIVKFQVSITKISISSAFIKWTFWDSIIQIQISVVIFIGEKYFWHQIKERLLFAHNLHFGNWIFFNVPWLDMAQSIYSARKGLGFGLVLKSTYSHSG